MNMFSVTSVSDPQIMNNRWVWYSHNILPKKNDKLKQVVQFIEKTMPTRRVEFTAGGKSLAEVKIQRRIPQGDALSPLLFVTAMMPLNQILRKCTARFTLSISQEKINHLMYIDDIKLFLCRKRIGNPDTKCENIQSRYRNGIWHRKCTMLVMKNGKRHMTEVVIRTLGEKETYKYLGILEADAIKQVEM